MVFANREIVDNMLLMDVEELEAAVKQRGNLLEQIAQQDEVIVRYASMTHRHGEMLISQPDCLMMKRRDSYMMHLLM